MFYEHEEERLIEEGEALEREVQEEESREERERERDVAAWADEDREEALEDVGEEGESTIGSLGVFLNGGHGGRERLSRSKSTSSTRGKSSSLLRSAEVYDATLP